MNPEYYNYYNYYYDYKINDISTMSLNLSAKCFTTLSLPKWATTSATFHIFLERHLKAAKKLKLKMY